ncbi:MAG TPA: hypothetical protein VI434_03190 [Candidatus Dormibacteraeota bacterium]
MTYATTLQSWHDFYQLTGTAAGSLVGLLFVGLSLHLSVVIKHPEVRALARMTLSCFGITLVLALFLMIPETLPANTGWELLILGAVGSLLIVRSLVSGLRSEEHAIPFWRLILRFGLTALTFIGISVCGVTLIAGDFQDALDWLVVIAVFLVVLSLRNSWDLLVSVGEAVAQRNEPS